MPSCSTDPSLFFPRQLSPEEIALSVPHLERAPQAMRQSVLDELQGRLASAENGATPVHNPIGYLAKLCRAVADETFQVTSAGLRTRQAREKQRAREAVEIRSQSVPLEIPASSASDCALARRLLNIRDRERDVDAQDTSNTNSAGIVDDTKAAMP